MMNERCFLFFQTQQSIAIDEAMISYYSRHGSKQRMAGKPIRVVYKLWVMALPDKYVIQFEPYQGAKRKGSTRSSPVSWGLGEHVVIDLLSELPDDLPFNIFRDNFLLVCG